MSFLGLLKEEDLHFRSHRSDRLFTIVPICLHQSISTLFSSGILQIRVEEIGVEPIPSDFQSDASTELASPPFFISLFQRCKDIENIFNFQIFLNYFFIPNIFLTSLAYLGSL